VNFTWDNQTGINLVLCIAIVVIGFMAWQRTRSGVILLVAGAFGLFGFSHLASLLGLTDELNTPLIVIRVTAYLLVTCAVLLEAYGKKAITKKES
jgi:CHASE2 domain-containing sensor protein